MSLLYRVLTLLLLTCFLLSGCAGEGAEITAEPTLEPQETTDPIADLFSPPEIEVSDEKIILNMATDAPGTLSLYPLILAFNESQDKYTILPSNYSDITDDGKSLDNLRTEIIAGTCPDIFAFTLSDTFSEIKPETLYMDLSEYLDNDSDLSRGDFYKNLLTALNEGDSVYWIPHRFSVCTFAARESLLGMSPVTLDDIENAASSNGLRVLPAYTTKGFILSWASKFAVEKYIDWENGTCNFDSEEFIQLLKLCGEWGNADVGYSDEEYLLQYEIIQRWQRLAVISDNYGGDYRFLGLPTGGSDGSMYQIEMKFAVSSQCENKDGAWEFIKFALSREGYEADISNPGFPALTSMIEEDIDSLVKNGYKDEFSDFTYTEEDAAKFWELMDNTETVIGANAVAISIIENEAEAYFAGDQTAEKTAELIQSRVQLYVGEQS